MYLSQGTLQTPYEVIIVKGTGGIGGVVKIIDRELELLYLLKVVVHHYGGGKDRVQGVLLPLCPAILETWMKGRRKDIKARMYKYIIRHE